MEVIKQAVSSPGIVFFAVIGTAIAGLAMYCVVYSVPVHFFN